MNPHIHIHVSNHACVTKERDMDEWKSGGKASREESQILNVKQCGHKHEGIEVMEFRALPLIAPPHL